MLIDITRTRRCTLLISHFRRPICTSQSDFSAKLSALSDCLVALLLRDLTSESFVYGPNPPVNLNGSTGVHIEASVFNSSTFYPFSSNVSHFSPYQKQFPNT